MDILVVGIGGNGQTYFMKYLEDKSFRINPHNDKGREKHMSCPTKIKANKKMCKIIYVYNNSFQSICSHYRRHWPVQQMNKININNTCKITNVEEYFSLTENSGIDHFGCKDHFLRWYNYDCPNGIYFLNLSKLNKSELSNFLECDKSIFDDLTVFQRPLRKKYNNLEIKYPLSAIMYKNIDKLIDNNSLNINKKYAD